MPQPIANIIAQLHAAHEAALTSMSVAETELAARLSLRLPLVHRTGKPGALPAREIFNRQVLEARPPETKCERDAGVAKVIYFFLGSGAYPKGNHALLLDVAALRGATTTATPFDSGACANLAGYLERRGSPFPAERDRCAHLDEYMLERADNDLSHFAQTYIPAHFNSCLDYVTRPQESLPDRDTHHRLTSPTNDRRAWTIEIQHQNDIQLHPNPAVLRRIVVEKRDLIMDLPLKYRSLAAVAAPRTMYDRIVDQCVDLVLR